MRTYSSKFLAILVAVILTLLAFGIAMLAHYFGENILVITISTAAFFVAAYFSILYIIKKYIIDRIRPLYNTIRDLPLSGKKLE